MTVGGRESTSPDGRRAPTSRNAPCSCGSGLPFKRCCGALEPFGRASRVLPPAFSELLGRALAAQQAQQFEAARVLYLEALCAVPEFPDALHMLGVVYLQTGDYASALDSIRRAGEAFDWTLPAVRHNARLAAVALLARGAVPEQVETWIAYRKWRDAPREARDAQSGRISVVVPAFNHANWVEAALDSLGRQTRPPDEVIVIDDGSTDETLARIRAVLPRCPGRTVLVARANRGAAATINEAVSLSTGDYVNVLNSDDRFAPTRLEAMSAAVLARGAEWGFSRVSCIDSAGRTIGPGAAPLADDIEYLADDVCACESVGLAFLSANPAVSSGNLFFSRALFERVGGFADLRYNHDWDFCLRASLIAEPEYVPRAGYEYRIHGANTILGATGAVAEVASIFERFHREAQALSAPDNPFAPIPWVWGRRYYLRLLRGGQAAMLPPEVLRACVDAAARCNGPGIP
jgi:glycosyltransferase involved in cell wall biosynthesis